MKGKERKPELDPQFRHESRVLMRVRKVESNKTYTRKVKHKKLLNGTT
jgi:hypothetical protein